MRRLVFALVAGMMLLALIPAVAGAQPVSYEPEDPANNSDGSTFTALPGAEVFSGIEDPGPAGGDDDWGWRIEKPADAADFNGTLVLYAHGFVSPTQTELRVQNPGIRPVLSPQGYAWAASSYSLNGYNINEPIAETKALRQIFIDETGLVPTRIVIHGVSMGGHVTSAAIEEDPTFYAGAYPICGVLAPNELFNYFNDTVYAAGALAGVSIPNPPPFPGFLQDEVPQIVDALGITGELTHQGDQWKANLEQQTGGERPIFDEAFAFWNSGPLQTPANSGVPFLFGVYGGALTGGPDTRLEDFLDNSDVAFQYDNDEDESPAEMLLNATIQRNTAEPGATPYYPEVEGMPTVPVLTLHDTGDLFVPFSMEQRYAERVAANGLSQNLVQRAIRGVGHCDFSAGEAVSGFNDLIEWMDDPTAKPEGDDVLDPDNVADRDFGCRFTIGERDGLAECGADQTLNRLNGPTRIETAIALSDAGFPDGADTVVLARADVYADALAGSALAGSLNAPILLSESDDLPEAVGTQITALDPSTVILLGGTAALSDDVKAQVEALGDSITVERIGGANRFATAVSIADRVGGDRVFVVEGFDADVNRGFADAIAVSGLAAFLEQPILLVTTEQVPAETAAALDAGSFDGATIIGGKAAVSEAVATEIDGDVGTVERLSGSDRYATSVAVTERSVASGASIQGLFVATGAKFPDALTAGPVAAASGNALILVDGNSSSGSAPVSTYLNANPRAEIFNLAGGEAAISAGAATSLKTAPLTAGTS